MAALALLALILAFSGSSDAAWCVCKSDAGDKALQTTLDYACGTGADCLPIHEKGACYDPNTVVAHCSYAANSYYQRKQSTGATCDFSGTATLTTTDPSSGSCTYPSSASTAGGNGSGSGIQTPTSNLSPPNLFGLGQGPSGSFSPDGSGDVGSPRMDMAGKCALLLALLLSALVFLL